MDDFDFDQLDLSDEGWEEAFDAFIDDIKDEVIEDEKLTTVLYVPKYKQLMFCYAVMKNLVGNQDATVSYKLFEPFKTMGSVSVEGNNLVFHDSEWLSRAAEFASNTEIYPLANGKVRMTFTFHGLTTSIE